MAKEDPIALIGEKEKVLLPATIQEICDYELEAFIPVSEPADDQETTRSDLAMLNNHLAMCNATLPYVRSLDGLCSLSSTVCKLIETRRRVKKLKLGDNGSKDSGKTFEVLE